MKRVYLNDPKKVLVIALALITSGYTVTNQEKSSSNQGSSAATNLDSNTKKEGCIDSENGKYTLHTSDQVYTLHGNKDALSNHVGHRVMISGKLSRENKEITVSKISKISDACPGGPPPPKCPPDCK